MSYRRLDKYLYRLDEIEVQARRRLGASTGAYLDYIIKEFLAYWRQLQKENPPDLKGRAWVRLEVMFDQKLREIACCRLEMQWMIFELDGMQLHSQDYDLTRPPKRPIRNLPTR